MFSDDLQTIEYTDAGCCCSDVELPTWDEPTWDETTTWADEPAATTAVDAAWGEGVDTAASSAWGTPAEQAPIDAPTVAYVGGTDLGYQAPIDAPTTAYVGGTDPWHQVQAPIDAPTVAYVGGTDPWHQGATIELPTVSYVGGTDLGYPAPIDAPTVAYVGGPNPWSEAAIEVGRANEAFSQLSLPEMKAVVFGGTPADWDTPTVPLYGHTPIHTVVNSQLTLDALRNLADNGVIVPFV